MNVAVTRRLCVAACIAAGVAAGPTGAMQISEEDRTGGPYVPTPQIVVDEMLRVGSVDAGDFVIDLGSGDGVIVLTAATQRRARGLGVDIDPELIKRSNDRAKALGVAGRAQFMVQDVFKTDLRKATVVTLYLLPEMMTKLAPKLYNELRPGTRIVSHDYVFDAWKPDATSSFHVPEKEAIMGLPTADIHLWVVPAKVGGRWRISVAGGGRPVELTFAQRYQELDADGSIAGEAVSVVGAALKGETIRFTVSTPDGPKVFTGKVTGNAMEGSVELPRGKGRARWTAVRVRG